MPVLPWLLAGGAALGAAALANKAAPGRATFVPDDSETDGSVARAPEDLDSLIEGPEGRES